MSGSLRLTREGVGIELRRGTFEVVLDGEVIDRIERGDTIEAMIEAGRHSLRVRGGRYSSRSHAFEIVEGGVISFRCHGAMMWPRYVASIVRPDLAVSLHRE